MIALKKEALQHHHHCLGRHRHSVALFQLLTMFLGTGEDAEGSRSTSWMDSPLIKQPLPLTSESSDEDDDGASTATAVSTAHPNLPPPLPPTAPLCALCKETDHLRTFVTSLKRLSCFLRRRRFMKQGSLRTCCLPGDKVHHTPRGGSLYLCKHPKCADQPFSGDLPGYGSHFRRVHLGICIGCPYCPDRRYWNSTGWLKHMKEGHAGAPWYGSQIVDEKAQAEALLAALQHDPTAHIEESAQRRLDSTLAGMEESTMIPEEGTQEEEGKPFNRPPTPSFEDFRSVMHRAPCDLRDYEYASGPHLEIRYRRTNPALMSLASSLVSADLLLQEPEEEEDEEQSQEEVEEEEEDSAKPPTSKRPKLE